MTSCATPPRELADSRQLGRHQYLILRFLELGVCAFEVVVEPGMFDCYTRMVCQHPQELEFTGGEGVAGFLAVQDIYANLGPPNDQRNHDKGVFLDAGLVEGFHILDDYWSTLAQHPVDNPVFPQRFDLLSQRVLVSAHRHRGEAFIGSDGEDATAFVGDKPVREIHQSIENILDLETETDRFGEFVQIEQLVHRFAQLGKLAMLAGEMLLHLQYFAFETGEASGTFPQRCGDAVDVVA